MNIPQAEQVNHYMTNCFVGTEDGYGAPGYTTEAIYTGTTEYPRIQMSRTDLPGGPIGDEMWTRLTVGLGRKEITW